MSHQFTSTPDGFDERAARIDTVLLDVLQRRLFGEDLPDEQVISEHSDLMPELGEELQLAAYVHSGDLELETRPEPHNPASSGAIRIRCPHCHQPIEISSDTPFTDVTCSGCGSHFSLAGEATETHAARTLKRLGQFELTERLGLGSFGTVWKARDTELDRTVAIKIPRQGKLAPDEVEQFLREARAAAQLKHPNIVAVHEVGRDDDTVFIVGDFISGVSLADWLRGQQPTYRDAASLCAKIADALHHAHGAGVIHRDLKPQNIMMDADNEPHLMDFGLARRDVGEVTMTMDGHVLGTPAYMSPEQARGEAHRADHRTDIYSLGVMLFELLTGELPFRGNARMLIHQVLHEEAPSPRRLNNSIPGDLETICLKCLEKEPGKRFETAKDVADELRRFLDGSPITVRAITQPERVWRWCKRNPVITILSMAIAVSLSLGTSVSLWQARQARSESERAASNEKTAIQSEYIAVMNLIESEWRDGNLSNVRSLLEKTNAYDERGFEWYYWLQKTHEERKTFYGHVGKLYSVAFSPNGQRVVSGGNDQVARVWEVATGKELITLNANGARSFEVLPREYGINGVGYSPDGKVIVTCSLDKTAVAWDAETGQERFRMPEHSGPAWTVAFSPDNTKIATTSQDGTVIVWNANTGKTVFPPLNGHGGNSVFGVTFSPDSSRIVTGGSDNEAVVWDARDGSELIRLQDHTGWVFSIAYSPDGRTIATASHDGTVRFWNGQDGQLLPVICSGHAGDVKCVKFSPDGSMILTGGIDATARLWDVETGRQLFEFRGHEGEIWSVDFSKHDQIATCSFDGTVKLWRVPKASAHLAASHSLTAQSDDHIDSSIAFFNDGRRVAIGSWDHSVSIVDIQTRKRLHHLKGHSSRVWSVAVSPNDEYLLTGGWDNQAILWDSVTGTELMVGTHSGGVRAVAFSPNGKTMATASEDSTVQIWDVASRSRTRTIQAHRGAVWAVAFSPDGERIVTGGGDKACRIWDVQSGSKLHELATHEAAVKAVAVTSDNLILTGSDDRICRIWDPQTESVRLLEGHRHSVTSVGVSKDSSRYVTGSRDSQVKLWDSATGREVLTLRGNRVEAVAISNDGRWIAAAGGGIPFLWKSATEEQCRAWSVEKEKGVRRVVERKAELNAIFAAKKAMRQQDPGAIKDWLILAPIPIVRTNEDESTTLVNALTSRTASDLQLRPQAGEALNINGQDFIWQERSLDDFHIDFHSLMGQYSGWSLAYAVCYIISEEKQTGIQLKVGSDDQSQILLNGKAEYLCPFTRAYMADTDNVPGLSLRKGLNTLVFKVANGVGGWEGSVRLTDTDGHAVPGIKVTLDPIGATGQRELPDRMPAAGDRRATVE